MESKTAFIMSAQDRLDLMQDKFGQLAVRLTRTEAALQKCKGQRDYFMEQMEWSNPKALGLRAVACDAELEEILNGK